MKRTAEIILPALLASLCALLFGSCATSKLAGCMEVSLVNLRFEEMTPFETTAIFTIRVQNQAADPLGVEGGVHKIYLDGQYIGSGVCNETLEIARLAEGIQTVKVHLGNLAMARLVKRIVEEKRVDYRLDSRIYAKYEGRSTTVGVSRTGSVDLKDFQPGKSAAFPLIQQ
jgi:LEA14-like dessication related protein